jgi:predicted phage baseplate assembly protein
MYIVVNTNTIQFGDGVHGAIPSGLPIRITYWAAPPGTYSGTVPASHGLSVTGESLGLSNGLPSQVFRLFQTPVVDGSQIIRVDEGNGPATWVYYQRMVDTYSTDLAYTTSTDANGVVSVIFGDGVSGRIPISQGKITADYAVGGGAVGNVAANALTVLSSAVSAVISVTNTQPSSGGADLESLDHIRIHAPLSITAINRAVALDDYAALALNISGIGKAAAFSTYYNTVNLYVHPSGDFTDIATLTSRVNALIPSITNTAWTGYLDDKKMATVSIQVLPPQYNNGVTVATGYVPVNVTVSVQVLPQYHQSTVQKAVQATIANLFRFTVVDFGTRISLSSLYHTVQEVEGVDYVNVMVLCRNEAVPQVAADVVCAAYEIPQVKQPITVNVSGGIIW